MEGRCCKCDNINPQRQDVMLDPDKVDKLKTNPGLSLSVLMPGHHHFTPSHREPEVRMSFPRGQARKSPKEFEPVDLEKTSGPVDLGKTSGPVDLGKTSGLSDDDISFLSHDSNKDSSIPEQKNNLEVSKYSFFERLEHYMDRVPICQENRGTVEMQ